MFRAESGRQFVGDAVVSIEEMRLLSDVDQLVLRMQADGSVPDMALSDVKTNYFTGIQEMAIPSAVTQTVQRVEVERDELGRSRRVITWLGKSAIDVAESGYKFHFAPAAHRRVNVEVAEAEHSQESIRSGIAQVFISPKMSAKDAPKSVAEAENLADSDAVRVSVPVVDAHGVVVARSMQSLLVSDIPLKAWTDMLQDPRNIFGKSIALTDTESALSVMGAFKQLDMPVEQLPEGPVSILKSVVDYIDDEPTKSKVLEQIVRFQGDQEMYRVKSEAAAAEWLEFDVELARSLKSGKGTPAIERFIGVLQHDWDPSELAVVLAHDVAGDYLMTNQFAAVLEKRFRHVLASRVAVETGNASVLAQSDQKTIGRLQEHIAELNRLESMQPSAANLEAIAMQRATLSRMLTQENFRVGGGCVGRVGGKVGSEGPDDLLGRLSAFEASSAENLRNNENDSSNWKWKTGVCRVKTCPSPKPTDVGPCSVCRNCQHKFDLGQDPTIGDTAVSVNATAPSRQDKLEIGKYVKKILSIEEPPEKPTKATRELALSAMR